MQKIEKIPIMNKDEVLINFDCGRRLNHNTVKKKNTIPSKR